MINWEEADLRIGLICIVIGAIELNVFFIGLTIRLLGLG
jgi:hypothetical protein